MGFCESYMAGELKSDNLAALIQLAVLHDRYIEVILWQIANPVSQALALAQPQ